MGDLDADQTDTITAFRQGDPRAFTEIYDSYFEELYLYSYKKLRDQTESEDVVIKAFHQLFKRYLNFYTLSEIRAFLYTVVLNGCKDHLKYVKRRTIRQKGWIDLTADDPGAEYAMMFAEIRAELYKSMEKLPAGCRTVLEMIYIEGLKYQDVADRLQISVGTVKSQRLDAINKLRHSFSLKDLYIASVIHVACLLFY